MPGKKIRVLLAGLAANAAAIAGPWNATSGAAATPEANPLASAPYLMPLENNPPKVGDVISATGVKAFTLAFILSDGGCGPVWSGGGPIASDTQVRAVIDQVRSAGGDVMPSIGGYAGNKLGETCTDPAALAGAYQSIIDTYQLKAIDLDIESTEFENDATQARIAQALKTVGDKNPGVRIYLTLPSTQDGLNWWGNNMVSKAVAAGTRVDGWTIMPFDFGGGATGMGQLTISVAEKTHAQLKKAYPGKSDDEVYAMTGISSMNGRTDAGEFVRQSDLQEILGYAQQHHLARFTFWSVNRDRQCDPAEPGSTFGTCSSVTQQPWEFTGIVAKYQG